MGVFGNLLKGVLNAAVSPIVVATDLLKGDFENTGKVAENIIDSIDDAVEDLTNGDL